MSISVTHRGATISPCGKYRYELTRGWHLESRQQFDPDRLLGVVMLNPSTADGTKDDPTIRRLISFGHALKFSRLVVCNLFALRSTSPNDARRCLLAGGDPIGPDNMQHLVQLAQRSDQVIVAWGAHKWAEPQAERMEKILRCYTSTIHALRITPRGAPEHPLYLPKTCTPVEWRGDL